MDRTRSELREAVDAAQALQDSYGALMALERIEAQLARTQVPSGESLPDAPADEQTRAVVALNHVLVALRAAQGQATTAEAITSLRHVIVELRAATAYAATAHAIASTRRASTALRWLASEGDTGPLASGFVVGREHPRSR